MKRKVNDWRKEGYNIGDKLYMTTQSSFFHEEPRCRYVYISHIGKTVLHVKPNLDENYTIKFNKGESTLSDWGQYHVLYSNEAEYLEAKKMCEYRQELEEKTLKLIDKLPNHVMEELIAKYGEEK